MSVWHVGPNLRSELRNLDALITQQTDWNFPFKCKYSRAVSCSPSKTGIGFLWRSSSLSDGSSLEMISWVCVNYGWLPAAMLDQEDSPKLQFRSIYGWLLSSASNMSGGARILTQVNHRLKMKKILGRRKKTFAVCNIVDAEWGQYIQGFCGGHQYWGSISTTTQIQAVHQSQWWLIFTTFIAFDGSLVWQQNELSGIMMILLTFDVMLVLKMRNVLDRELRWVQESAAVQWLQFPDFFTYHITPSV